MHLSLAIQEENSKSMPFLVHRTNGAPAPSVRKTRACRPSSRGATRANRAEKGENWSLAEFLNRIDQPGGGSSYLGVVLGLCVLTRQISFHITRGGSTRRLFKHVSNRQRSRCECPATFWKIFLSERCFQHQGSNFSDLPAAQLVDSLRLAGESLD